MSVRRRARAFGKRRLDREARRHVLRVMELSEAGYSTSTIAASVGLSEDAVRWILQRERELKSQRGEGA